MFTPTTNLRLLSTPLESDYRNTLWFPNVTAQTAYFTSKTVKTYANFNYIKKDNTIVVPEEVDNLYNCNYIMYQNSNFGQRWFYAFINRVEWASNGSTRLYVSTDVIQTWFFDITYYQSYVDRCHSDTDVAGDNIVPEDFSGVNSAGYYQVGTQDLTPNTLTIFSTVDSHGDPLECQKINGIVSGSGELATIDVTAGAATVNTWLNTMVRQGLANAVSRVQQYPTNHSTNITFAKHPSSLVCPTNGVNQSYTPTNKKLLSGAFLDAYVTFYGQEMNFNPEFINGSQINVSISTDITTGTVGAVVNNYGNANITTMSMVATIPESTWAYNQYKNDYNLHSGSNAMYQRRQQTNRNLGIVTSGLNTAASALGAISDFTTAMSPASTMFGLVTGSSNPIANVASGLSGIASTVDNAKGMYYSLSGIDEISQDLAAIAESYNAPPTGGIASSNIFLATNKTAMSYGYKVPPLDIVKRCDKYLSVYGYKQSIYRTINLHARANWTYIKTMGLNAAGNFPDDDMRVVKKIFDNGIFFWAYTATFGNFDQANPIV